MESNTQDIFTADGAAKGFICEELRQLDNIIRTLYEDRMVGRITPERYDQLSMGYEQEQAEIKANVLSCCMPKPLEKKQTGRKTPSGLHRILIIH